MLKKIYGAVALLMCPVLYCAAYSPALELTRSEVRKFMATGGPFPQTMDRMEDNDPSLTTKECALLYYGYSYTGKYVHDREAQTELAIYELAENEQYDEAWAMCESFLAENPFSMFALNLGVFLADYRRDFEKENAYLKRSGRILEVIEESGDGSAEYPFQIVYFSDALYYLQYQIGVDKTLGMEEFRPKGLVFDVEVYSKTEKVYFAFDLCK